MPSLSPSWKLLWQREPGCFWYMLPFTSCKRLALGAKAHSLGGGVPDAVPSTCLTLNPRSRRRCRLRSPVSPNSDGQQLTRVASAFTCSLGAGMEPRTSCSPDQRGRGAFRRSQVRSPASTWAGD